MKRGKKITFSYAIDQLKNGWNDWRWYYFQFTNHVVSKYFSLKHNKGTCIWEEEWDNLIILDGCRYDIFEEKLKHSDIQGRLEKRISRGSSTKEFLIENFGDGRQFPDIVYITANPFVNIILKNNTFYKTLNVWKYGWDDEKGTVPPGEVEKAALNASVHYSQKRKIIHFMQPHCPFIGTYKKEGNFWQIALDEGKNEAMKAYRSNLDLVFPYVETLLRVFKGNTAVTSDHGQACGERATPLKIPIYGHPNGVHIPALVEVPWLITNSKTLQE